MVLYGTQILCCSCHASIYFPEGVEDRLRESKKGFYCLNGHQQHFAGPSPRERRITELERERDELSAEVTRVGARLARAEREQRLDKHRCKLCPKRYESEPALTSHMRRVHQNGMKRLPEKAGGGL